ncbi:MAG: helix-hairpin-helix domain-containing protein [Planctomycetes bacterium]|nr:helix-hairpin-helix domain-containing protein [Planctomycetota bacterium]
MGSWLFVGLICVWRRLPPTEIDVDPAAGAAAFEIDLNSASWEQLVLLPGIGETLARRIVEARERRGGFRNLEEVMALPGVPDRPFQRARSYITLRGPTMRSDREASGGGAVDERAILPGGELPPGR